MQTFRLHLDLQKQTRETLTGIYMKYVYVKNMHVAAVVDHRNQRDLNRSDLLLTRQTLSWCWCSRHLHCWVLCCSLVPLSHV